MAEMTNIDDSLGYDRQAINPGSKRHCSKGLIGIKPRVSSTEMDPKGASQKPNDHNESMTACRKEEDIDQIPKHITAKRKLVISRQQPENSRDRLPRSQSICTHSPEPATSTEPLSKKRKLEDGSSHPSKENVASQKRKPVREQRKKNKKPTDKKSDCDNQGKSTSEKPFKYGFNTTVCSMLAQSSLCFTTNSYCLLKAVLITKTT